MIKNTEPYRLLIAFAFFSYYFISCQNTEKKETFQEKSVKISKQNAETKPSFTALEEQMMAQGLVNIQQVDSSLRVELKYSSTDNFFGKDVYGDLTRAYLQPQTAQMLAKANGFLQENYPNYRLLVYDATRPLSIQHILWNSLDSIPPKNRKNFVADPAVGSIHNFGCAVDLTVIDISKNLPLDMGTKYDYFGYLAYPRKETEMLAAGNLSEKQIENRLILRKAMQAAGFMPITSEWWHFNAKSRADAKKNYAIVK